MARAPKSTGSKRPGNLPVGRHISDLWLDGKKDRLHPAEKQLLSCAARGVACKIGTKRPALQSKTNIVRAALLRFIALGGDEENPLHDRGVELVGAWIDCKDGDLDFEGARFKTSLWLHKCAVNGSILLRDAKCASISLSGSSVHGVAADRLQAKGSLFLYKGFRARDIVNLGGANITGDLVCSNGRFDGAPDALSCPGLETGGHVFLLDDFHAAGEVDLVGAKIGGQLSCCGARLLGTPVALQLQNGDIGESLFLNDEFFAEGTVDLTALKVGSALHCQTATFAARDKAIHAPRATIAGDVRFSDGSTAEGPVSFQGASIGGDITFAGGIFLGKPAVNLKNARIGSTIIWRGVREAVGDLDLSGASCTTINMDWQSWEIPSQIVLDAFTYLGFSQLPDGSNARFWQQWLDRQPKKHLGASFRPNPYTQLAKVLDNMGHEEEARSVRIAQRRKQNEFRAQHEDSSTRFGGQIIQSLEVFWNDLQGLLVDYGYRPGKAVIFLIGVIVVGAAIYSAAARYGIMTPAHPLIFKEAGNLFEVHCTQNYIYKPEELSDKEWADCQRGMPSEYSTFSALIYSADVALPIVNFRMENDWSPRVVDWRTGEAPDHTARPLWGWGWWVRTWEWVQITLGWLLSLIFVSAVGGIIRR